MWNAKFTEQKLARIYQHFDPEQPNLRGSKYQHLDDWLKDIRDDPRLYEAILGKDPETKYQIKATGGKDDNTYLIVETHRISERAPNYERALSMAIQLRERNVKPIVPRSVLPKYLRVIGSMPQSGGKWNCVFLWDQVPKAMQPDNPIANNNWELAFDVPLPKTANKLDEVPRKIALLEGVLGRVTSHINPSGQQDAPPHNKDTIQTYHTVVDQDEWSTISKGSIEEQLAFLSDKHTHQSETSATGPATWPYGFQKKVEAYFVKEQESETVKDGDTIDGSEYIRVLARVERKEWESIDKRNKRTAKRTAIEKQDARATVKLNIKGICFKLQGKIAKGFRQKTNFVYAGGRNIGKTLANLMRGHLIALTFPNTIILCFRNKLGTLQDAVVGTLERQILADLLKTDRTIRVEREGGSPKKYHYPNNAQIQLIGLQEKTDVLSAEADIGIGIQMDGITESDYAYVRTSLGRGAGKNTPYSGLVMGDANPDEDFGEEHWLLHYENIGIIKVTHKDNPEWWDPDKKEWTAYGTKEREMHKSTLKGNLFDRLSSGHWAKNKHLVYPEFERSRHIASKLPKPLICDKAVLAADWGYSDPTTLMIWARILGKWYFVRGMAKVEVSDTHYWGRKALAYAEWTESVLGTPIEIIHADNSPAAYPAALREAGFTVHTSKKSVLQGVAETKKALEEDLIAFLKNATDEPDPLMIERRLKLTVIDEFFGYYFPDSRGVSTGWDVNPIEKNGHWLAATRYFVVGEKIAEIESDYEDQLRPITYSQEDLREMDEAKMAKEGLISMWDVLESRGEKMHKNRKPREAAVETVQQKEEKLFRWDAEAQDWVPFN